MVKKLVLDYRAGDLVGQVMAAEFAIKSGLGDNMPILSLSSGQSKFYVVIKNKNTVKVERHDV